MKEITVEKIQELMNDHDFVNKLQKAESVDQGISLLKENGIDITRAEVENGYKKGVSYLEEIGYLVNGELTEAGLEMVAGGSRLGYGVAKLGAGAAGAGLGLMLAGVCLTPAAGLIIVGTIVAVGCCNL